MSIHEVHEISAVAELAWKIVLLVIGFAVVAALLGNGTRGVK